VNVVTVASLPIDNHYDRRIRAWLLALLRYAITLDDEDRLAALAAASEIDKSDPRRSGDFQFFHRTSASLCEAVANPVRGNLDVVRCHLNRMSDERMKRAFAAVLDLDRTVAQPAARTLRGPERHELWKGLKSKPAQQSS
jgi:hypothetical protein